MNRAVALLLTVPLLALTGCGPGGAPDEPPDPVSVNIIEASASVEVGGAFQFHFSVSNTTNKACSWSVNDVAGGDATVGTITADGLYAAPAAVPNPGQVTVKAVAAADATKSDTAVVTITAPPPFTISPGTATVPAGETRQFTTTAEVDWSLEGAAGNTASLGDIAANGLFTAPLSPPLGGSVTVVATSKADPSVHAAAVATITFSDASLQGDYAFTYRATDAGQIMFVGGRFTSDGRGGISDGVMAMTSQTRGQAPSSDVTFTGAYAVQADGRAAMTVQTATESFPMRLALADDSAGRMMAFETGRTGAGDLARQDPSSFAAGLTGSYVLAYDGTVHVLGTAPRSGQPLAAVIRFSTTASGTLTDIVGDINVNGVWQNGGYGGTAASGTFGPANLLSGRGYLNLDGTSGAQQFLYFMLSSDEAFLVSIEWGSMFPKVGVCGKLMRQGSGPFGASSLAGDLVTVGHGYGAIPVPTPDPYVAPWPAFSGGVITADGAGNLAGGTADNNVNGTVGQALPVAGVYEVAANGRGGLTMSAGGTNHAAFCLLSNNRACIVGVDSWGAGGSLLVPQAGGRPFSPATLNGRFALALKGTLASAGTDVTGAILLNGLGDLAGVVDINASGTLTPDASAAGTYSLSSIGRGTMTIHAATRTLTMTMYLVDPGTVLLMGTSDPFSGTLTRQY